jgi:hypothetical protein
MYEIAYDFPTISAMVNLFKPPNPDNVVMRVARTGCHLKFSLGAPCCRPHYVIQIWSVQDVLPGSQFLIKIPRPDLQLWEAQDKQNMEAFISNTKLRLRQFLSFVYISYNRYNYKQAFRDCGEAGISVKSVNSISILWRPWGKLPGRCPLNSALE